MSPVNTPMKITYVDAAEAERLLRAASHCPKSHSIEARIRVPGVMR